jgi:hypothetical protein
MIHGSCFRCTTKPICTFTRSPPQHCIPRASPPADALPAHRTTGGHHSAYSLTVHGAVVVHEAHLTCPCDLAYLLRHPHDLTIATPERDKAVASVCARRAHSGASFTT